MVEDDSTDSEQQRQLSVDAFKQPGKSYAQSKLKLKTAPKKILVDRKPRPKSYAAATSETTFLQAQKRNFSPSPTTTTLTTPKKPSDKLHRHHKRNRTTAPHPSTKHLPPTISTHHSSRASPPPSRENPSHQTLTLLFQSRHDHRSTPDGRRLYARRHPLIRHDQQQ